jgi:iron complex transport system ATP-binding protein
VPLRADDLGFEYRRGRPVLAGVSLGLEPGTITAIVGPNGAGKSTLLRLLLGILGPTAGRVTLDGTPVAEILHRQRARHVAYVPQRASVAFAFTVREFVSLGRYAAGEGGDPGAIERTLRRVDLADRAEDPFPILSVGQQQRAALGRALVQLDGHGGTRVLLADEPVSAMDPRQALLTMRLLRDLAATGAAIAVVLHDLTLALRVADQALVLDGSGRPAALGPAAATLTPSMLDPVFGVRFGPAGPAAPALVPALP